MKPDIKILVLDKEEIIFKSIQKALNNDAAFYDITYCTNSFDGLKNIRSDKFDLVLIDIVLPGMNAMEAIRRIKNIDSTVPVVVMSGSSLSGIDFQDEILNSAAGFLLKPFTTEEIKSLILRVLKTNIAAE
jgi:two-component system response regulator ArlR